MALTPTVLGQNAYTSADTNYAIILSATPDTDALILACFGHAAGTPPPTPTVAGCGLTWVEATSANITNTSVHVFRAMGTPTSSGPVVFTHSSNQTRGIGHVIQWTGAATSGSDGAGAIVQSTSRGETFAVSTMGLNAFADATNNVAFGTADCVLVTTSGTIGGEAGFTLVGPDSVSAPTGGLLSQYFTGQSTAINFTTTVSNAHSMVVMEIKMSTAAPSLLRPSMLALLGVG